VVISRSRLPGLAIHYAATTVLVGPLSERDGLILLNQAAGEEIDQQVSAQLVRYCGGLPLALRIVAQRVAEAPVQDVVAELANQQARLDALDAQDDAHSAVRTVFSWSYHGLPDHEARAFRLLGLHPTTEFGTGAVAAVLRLSPDAVTKVLRSLTRRHLVLDLGQGRFGLHDLLRTYAAEVCTAFETAEDRTFLLTLLFDHYLHSADDAGRIVMPHRLRFPLEGRPQAVPALLDRGDALRWFDVERRNLEAMCALDSPALDARTWQLAYTLRDYYFLDKLLDGWRFTHEQALSATLRLGDTLAEARTRNNLGMALVQAGRLDDAETHYIRAHELFEQHGDGHGSANALANLASVLRRRGQFAEALRNQQLALSWYRQAGAARNTGITLRSMALVEMELERFADAVQHAEEALAIAIGLGLDVDAAEGFGRLGRIQHRAGDDAAAEMALRLAVAYSRRSGSRHEEARALHQLGDVAATVGRAADARRWWLDALGLYRDLGSNEAKILAAALAALPADQ
jgi:tetratricopeptide (TPR) repeat protein